MSSNRKLFWDQILPFVRLKGEGIRSFLHGQTTSDFLEVQDDFFIHSCWLNAAGRVKAILEIRLRNDVADVVVLGGDINEVIKGFEQAIFPADRLEIESTKSIRRLQDLVLRQFERSNNIEWILPEESLPKTFQRLIPASSNQVNRWKMENGFPLGIGELKADYNPIELGLFDLVSVDKGCYLGQEMIAKLLKLGKVRNQLRFWESDKNLSVGQKLSTFIPDSSSKKICGIITSSVKNLDKDGSFGLAIVRSSVFATKKLYLLDDLTKVDIKVPLGFVDIPEKN